VQRLGSINAPFILAIYCLLLSSCVTNRIESRLSKHFENQTAANDLLIKSLANNKRVPITWANASKKLKTSNLEILQSIQSVRAAEKSKKKQWLTLIPKLNAFGGLNQNIAQISSLDSDDINARVTATFNIPNPVRFYGQLYASALQVYATKWAHELVHRRKHLQLFNSFLEEEELKHIEQSIVKEKKALSYMPLDKLEQKMQSIKNLELTLDQRKSLHKLTLNQLFNTPGKNWQPVGSTPEISYASQEKIDAIKLGHKYGTLALNLQTIQIESSILQLWNINAQRLPLLNLGISSPTLFSNTGDGNFSTDDLLFFSGISKTIDITDITDKEALRTAKIRASYTESFLKQRMESELIRLEKRKNTYKKTLVKKSKLLKEITRLQNRDLKKNHTVLDDLKKLQDLKNELKQVDRELKLLDLQFWIWDDAYWKN